MPRKVDHDERRRHIVTALLRIVGRQGLETVSLREVALEAGVSLGAVQHYFASKDDMLLFALEVWLGLDIAASFSDRVRRRLADRRMADETAITAATTLRAVAAEYLPHDEPSRAEARIALAFLSRAAVEPALASALIPAYAGFLDTLRKILQRVEPPLDATSEARHFAGLLDGLRQPVMIGALTYADALLAVEHHLSRLLSFSPDSDGVEVELGLEGGERPGEQAGHVHL